MTKKPPLEKVLVKKIKDSTVNMLQLFKYHGGMFGVTGHSDLYGHFKCCGKAVYIEVKREGKKPTPAQINFIDTMRCTGAVAFWCDDLEMCMSILRLHICG